jgi:hypothetical protein
MSEAEAIIKYVVNGVVSPRHTVAAATSGSIQITSRSVIERKVDQLAKASVFLAAGQFILILIEGAGASIVAIQGVCAWRYLKRCH